MSAREQIKSQIDSLPENIVEKLAEFISFQKFSHNIFETDTEYLGAIPTMNEIIKEGMETNFSDCIPLAEVRKGVRS